MERVAIPELASAMLRFYGARAASTLADCYASEAIAHGDSLRHFRWAKVAVLLRDVVQLDDRRRTIATR